jgi:hypothetical protein
LSRKKKERTVGREKEEGSEEERKEVREEGREGGKQESFICS